MKYFLIALIKIYQKTLSPDHGLFRARFPHGYCRFYPSCSQYAIESLKQYGTIKGSYLSFLRVLKCNPFSHPKVDLP